MHILLFPAVVRASWREKEEGRQKAAAPESAKGPQMHSRRQARCWVREHSDSQHPPWSGLGKLNMLGQ